MLENSRSISVQIAAGTETNRANRVHLSAAQAAIPRARLRELPGRKRLGARAVPDYALQAEEIYRLEIGAAFFIAFYLMTMAFVLALGGSGFAEFGTQGLKARKVLTQQESTQQKRLDHRVLQKLHLLEQRLEKLEGER